MTDVPLRVRLEFVDTEARAGIERLKKSSRTALTPMEKAAKRLRAGLKKLGIEGDKAGKKIKKSMSGGAFAIRGIATEMESALRGLVIGLGAVTAAGGLLGRQAVNMSAEFEVLKITFESLTGSITQADQLIRDMKEFAVRTPLQLRDIEEGGTTLIALGEAAEDVIPILGLLGQAAVAMNKPLEQFIRARNLLSQGVVLSRTLAPLGISRATLEEFGAAAGATGAELVTAFDKALGRFEGLFERTFNTIRGRMSNLKDELDVMFAAIGDPMRDILISTVDQITGFLGEVRTFFETNKEAIEEAFLSIKASAEAFLAPVTNVLGKFFADLRDNPEKIQALADSFVNLGKAAARLLIFGTVTVGLLKFVAAITLLRIALPQLLATLGLAVKATGGLSLAFSVLNPWALAITATIALVTGAVILYNEGQIKAAERTAALRTELEAQLIAWKATQAEVENVNRVQGDLAESTATNEEKFRDMRNAIQAIIDQNPEFIKKLGLVQTSSGQLETQSGTLIDTWAELNAAWTHFDSTNVVTQINNVTAALNNLTREEFLGRPFDFHEVMVALTRGPGAVRELRLQQFAARLPEAGEQPDLINRFLQQFPGGAGAGDDDTTPPGGRAGGETQAQRIRRLREEQRERLLKEFNRELSPLVGALTNLKRSIIDEIQARRDLAEVLRQGKIDAVADFRVEQLNRAKEKGGTTTREEAVKEMIKGLGFDTLKDYLDSLKGVANEFITQLSRTLGDFIAQLGKTGGKADVGGFVSNLIGIGADAVGASLFGKGGFAQGGLFAKGAALGGLGPGLVAGAIAGGVGFVANRLRGEDPLKIEQPVDIRIVDIETRLKNFFNFRGLDPFTFSSQFRLAFENGVY